MHEIFIYQLSIERESKEKLLIPTERRAIFILLIDIIIDKLY